MFIFLKSKSTACHKECKVIQEMLFTYYDIVNYSIMEIFHQYSIRFMNGKELLDVQVGEREKIIHKQMILL